MRWTIVMVALAVGLSGCPGGGGGGGSDDGGGGGPYAVGPPAEPAEHDGALGKRSVDTTPPALGAPLPS